MVNYPNGKKTAWIHAPARFGDRGMNLEKDINTTNQYYLGMDRAVIHKKPTPVQIVKVDYPMRSAAKITEAYFKIPSTTDYNGVYRGKYIDFEAKECQSKTAFSLSYIHPHQITHLEKCRKHGGICFVIFRLTYHNLTYLVDAQEMIDYIRGIERKSIPYKWIMTHGHSIQSYYGRPVDYLEVVDRLYFKNEEVTNVISKEEE